jgi:hypothetical protein
MMNPPPDPADDAAKRCAALDVELFAHGARTLAQAQETRPTNTNKTYGPKQKEWRVKSHPSSLSLSLSLSLSFVRRRRGGSRASRVRARSPQVSLDLT